MAVDPMPADPAAFVHALLVRLERQVERSGGELTEQMARVREDLREHVTQERAWQQETTERLGHALHEIESLAGVRADLEKLKGWKLWLHGVTWPLIAAAAFFSDHIRAAVARLFGGHP